MPCIHCSKTGVKIGLILDAGIVCNSCAYHFRALRICDLCGQKKRNVHIYTIIDEIKKYCYQCVKFKFHEKCTACKNKELIHYCDLQRQPYCKRCTLIEKTCQICHQRIPAGKRANKCNSCSYKILLNSRTKKALHGLEPNVMNLFECLFNHLYDHKGVENTAKVIPYLHPVILQINNYFLQYQKLPNMLSVDLLKTSKFKHYHFILSFLHDYMSQDYKDFKVSQMISRQTNKLNKNSPHFNEFKKYIAKIQKRQITLHSKRLAITSAVMILTFTKLVGANCLCQKIVDQFCWLYWGQRASITGFINHINMTCNLSLKIKKEEYFKFEQRRESKMRLEQQILDICIELKVIDKNTLLKKILAYMHNIELPKDLEKLDLINIMSLKDKIRLRNLTFPLPLIDYYKIKCY